MGNAGTAQELKRVLGIEGVDVPVGKETLTIRPFKFGQIPLVLSLLGDLLADDTDFDIVKALTEGSEAIFSCLEIATGKKRAWFNSIEVDEGIALVMAVYQVNEELFKKKLLPLLAKMKLPAGPASSINSLARATRLKRSRRSR